MNACEKAAIHSREHVGDDVDASADFDVDVCVEHQQKSGSIWHDVAIFGGATVERVAAIVESRAVLWWFRKALLALCPSFYVAESPFALAIFVCHEFFDDFEKFGLPVFVRPCSRNVSVDTLRGSWCFVVRNSKDQMCVG